jgi:SAM-dependent methyltransferase
MRQLRDLVRGLLDGVGLLGHARRLLGRNADGTPQRPAAEAASAASVAVAEPSSPTTAGAGAVPVESTVPKASSTGHAVTIDAAYQARLEAERRIFANNIKVHDLPAIYHYWSNKHWLPRHKPFGFTCPDSFYCLHLERILHRSPTAVFLSVGAGNCDTEVRLAQMLRDRGHTAFIIECLDLNEDMLARGRALANTSKVSQHMRFETADFNRWVPGKPYDAVIANQSLHHVEALERLFDTIRQAIGSTGIFLTSDMIGRNGHMPWPEAMTVIREFWRELPDRYRYNQQLNRYEAEFEYWDCSRWGFEGVRAQDILPLLIENFEFESFFAFAGIIDPFIGRAFGHNFDVTNATDLAFIDRVQERDMQEMTAGRITPTHILAAMRARPATLTDFIPPFTPTFCVRKAVA